jgi:hypothetical protein
MQGYAGRAVACTLSHPHVCLLTKVRVPYSSDFQLLAGLPSTHFEIETGVSSNYGGVCPACLNGGWLAQLCYGNLCLYPCPRASLCGFLYLCRMYLHHSLLLCSGSCCDPYFVFALLWPSFQIYPCRRTSLGEFLCRCNLSHWMCVCILLVCFGSCSCSCFDPCFVFGLCRASFGLDYVHRLCGCDPWNDAFPVMFFVSLLPSNP